MTGLMRLVPRGVQYCARTTPSSSALASSSRVHVRALHASPALDPTEHTPAATLEDAAAVVNASADTSKSVFARQEDDFVHVKLAYLHPSTKEPMRVPRMGDIKRGRIRAEPYYVPLTSYVFGVEPRRDVLHSAVVYYLDGLRQGTASTKTRGEVAFSGRKLSPQKGTGRARRGTRGSPLLRKGGVAHGPKPRDFSTKLNRRIRELALRSALSLRWRMGDLHVVKNFTWQAPPQSCGPLAKLLGAKGWRDVLFLTAPRAPQPGEGMGRTAKPSAVDPVYTTKELRTHAIAVRNFAVACGNIPRTEMINLSDLTQEAHEEAKKPLDRKRPGELHAYEVLARKKLVCDLGAIEWLEEKLGGALFHGLEGELDALDLVDAESPLLLDAERTDDSVSAAADESAVAHEDDLQDDVELTAAEDEAIRRETERVLKDVPGGEGESESEKK